VGFMGFMWNKGGHGIHVEQGWPWDSCGTRVAMGFMWNKGGHGIHVEQGWSWDSCGTRDSCGTWDIRRKRVRGHMRECERGVGVGHMRRMEVQLSTALWGC
jgi:hypothetical protein